MPSVEIKDVNALIDNKPFSYQFIKINKKRMKSLSKCQEMMTITRGPKKTSVNFKTL